jgi:hypothetical protein
MVDFPPGESIRYTVRAVQPAVKSQRRPVIIDRLRGMLATEIAASPVTYGASVLWDNRTGVYT